MQKVASDAFYSEYFMKKNNNQMKFYSLTISITEKQNNFQY